MHTSSILTASDFTYRSITREQTEVCDFSAFCPAYNEQDRVGVVTLHPEDGIRHCGIALLAITTCFYDTLRSRYDEFFDYPQHFRNQINCLFWPENMPASASGNYLPGYARQLMSRRLKSVLYYHAENPTLEIQGKGSALEIVSGSLDRLGPAICNDRPPHRVQRFRSLTPSEFLHDMTGCFES